MEEERAARRIASWVTPMAVAAWLVLLLFMHAWDRDLTEKDHRLQQPAFWLALWLSGAAVLLELSLLRQYALDALFRLSVVLSIPFALLVICEREPYAMSVGIALVGAPVLVVGSGFARMRVAALLLGGGLAAATYDEFTPGFACGSMRPWPVHVANSMMSQHEAILATLLVAATTFGIALRGRRTRGLGRFGLAVCAAAVSLELLSTTAHRQLLAAFTDRRTSWWVDELAGTASVVECLLAAVLAGAAVSTLMGVARRKRRFDTRGAAPALATATLIVLAAQVPTRATVGWSTPPSVPLARASDWERWRWREGRLLLGVQNLLLTRDGEAHTQIGHEPLDTVRMSSNAEARIWPHPDAPASALERTLRQLLTRVPEVGIATAIDAGPGLPTPGVDTRVRFMPAAALRPKFGFQRVIRTTSAVSIRDRPEDRLPCPSANPDESVEQWLQRKAPSCTLRPAPGSSASATPLAPVEARPRWTRRREPRRPEPLFAAALLGLVVGLLLGHRRVEGDLAPLRGPRGPHRGPRRRAPTHPSWLWYREATHWWPRGATPYRDVSGFHGPAGRRAARRLLARRLVAVIGRTWKLVLVWCAIGVALAAASVAWSLVH